MTQMTRVLVGFFVAPAVPAILLYVVNRLMGYGSASVVGPLLLMPLGYAAAVIFGIPAYFLMQKRNVHSFVAYVLFGGLIGFTFYLLFTIATSYPGQVLLVLQRSLGPILTATAYAAIAAGVFWTVAIRRISQS
jgi:hypothetical protein